MLLLPPVAVLALATLAGCATAPVSTLPTVQSQLAARSNVQVAWPQTEEEKTDVDRLVHELLSEELSPDRAVQIAVVNNRNLRATFEEIGLSQADLMAAGRLHNPAVGVSVRWPDHAPRSPNVGLSFAVDLLDNLLIPIRRKVVREQLAQSEQRVAHDVLALAADVKAAAFTLQARQQFRVRVVAIAEVNETAADLAQRQYDAGNISQLDLANVQVSAQEASLELARTDAQVRADRERLNRLLGLSGGQINWTMNTNLPGLPESEPDLSDLEDVAVAQRLDLSAAKTQVGLAARALSLKRKTRFLPVSISAGVDAEREVDGNRLAGPTLELGLPIFDQGQADMARLTAELRGANATFEGLTNDIRSDVRESRDALLAARATANFYATTLVPQRRFLLRETLLHYNAMQKSNYGLLAAREQLLITERESVEALRDYWIALTQLERVVGGKLSAGDRLETSSGMPATSEENPLTHTHHSSS